MTALVLFAHGSSIESANDAVRSISERVRQAGSYPLVATAFLEGGRPDLAGAFAEVMQQGADRIIVVPYFLTLGLHLQRDLPRILEQAAGIYEGIPVEVAAPLDGHPALAGIVLDRAAQIDKEPR